MRYMAFNDSEILREFGRLMGEKDGLTKVAQVVPSLTPEQQAAWAKVLEGHGPGTKAWTNAETLLQNNKAYSDLMAQAKNIYFNESSNDAMAWKKHLEGEQSNPSMALQPAAPRPTSGQAAPAKGASVSETGKTAEQKAYDVTGKEDLVHEAHPNPAKTCGDELVENLNEQQDADKEVAEKSARDVLVALYKLAKRLKSENNDEAFTLVKNTFLDISNSLKK